MTLEQELAQMTPIARTAVWAGVALAFLLALIGVYGATACLIYFAVQGDWTTGIATALGCFSCAYFGIRQIILE